MKLYTSGAIAAILSLSERRIRQLRDSGIITETKPGLYKLEPTVRDYVKYIKDGSGGAEYNTERALFIKAKRQNAELDLKVKDGTLHESEEIETVMKAMLINFKSRLMSIPSKMSPILATKTDNKEIFTLLKGEVDEALAELSDFDTAFAVKNSDVEKD